MLLTQTKPRLVTDETVEQKDVRGLEDGVRTPFPNLVPQGRLETGRDAILNSLQPPLRDSSLQSVGFQADAQMPLNSPVRCGAADAVLFSFHLPGIGRFRLQPTRQVGSLRKPKVYAIRDAVTGFVEGM